MGTLIPEKNLNVLQENQGGKRSVKYDGDISGANAHQSRQKRMSMSQTPNTSIEPHHRADDAMLSSKNSSARSNASVKVRYCISHCTNPTALAGLSNGAAPSAAATSVQLSGRGKLEEEIRKGRRWSRRR